MADDPIAALRLVAGLQLLLTGLLVAAAAWFLLAYRRDRAFTRAQKTMMLAAAKILGVTPESHAYQAAAHELGYGAEPRNIAPEVLVLPAGEVRAPSPQRPAVVGARRETVVHGTPPPGANGHIKPGR